MTLVDASVALKWFIEESQSEEAAVLAANDRLTAPELLRAEVGNALIIKALRGDIDRTHVRLAFDSLNDFIVRFLPMAPLADRALDIALELNHPIYDCYYLAAAEIEDDDLVTVDKRLIAKAAGSRFSKRLRAL